MTRFDRQSFLGADSDQKLRGATIGVVGLGGGGSHVVQQTGHVGIGGHVAVDPDHITSTNTNRLVGGRLSDLDPALDKTAIAERLLRDLQEEPRIIAIPKSWHDATDDLKRCNIIVGAMDSFKEREQLERFARSHLIPYIDIGMDVHPLTPKTFLIGGQVILSMPGKPCLRCCGLITDERLKREAEKYGAAGSNPQVVWPNGVLASTAVGLVVQLLTPWFNNPPEFVYLDYDGNKGTLTPNDRMEFLANTICPHHPANEVGDPLLDIRDYSNGVDKRAAARLAALHPPKKLGLWQRLWLVLTGA
jgi:hypothetical protein